MTFQQTPQDQNVLRISKERVSVCPEAVKYILGDNWREPKGIVKRWIEKFYDVQLTVLIDPIRDFNPNDWTGNFYDDPQIVVTGPTATKTNGQYDSWNVVPDIIRKIDIDIRKRHKEEVLGLHPGFKSMIYQGFVQSYKTDPESLHTFQKGFEEIIEFCEEEYDVKITILNSNISQRIDFMIKGECWETVMKSRWMLKKTEAEQREVQKYREQKQTPPKCQLCEHTSKDCKKATEQYEWQQHLIRIGNETRHNAEWEKKIEDYYTNVSYHEEWMIAVDEKDHERELKEGISKPEDWYYTKKYGWFRKALIKDAEEIAKEGWTDEW